MAESELRNKIAEQWRLVKSAPVPYIGGLLVLAVVIFGALQWGYLRTLESKNSTIEALTSQVGLLNTDDNLLRQKLGLPSLTPVDPNVFYQAGVIVAKVVGVKIAPDNSVMEADTITFNDDYVPSQNVYFRAFELRPTTLPFRLTSKTVTDSKWDILVKRSGF